MPRVLQIVNRLNIGGITYNAASIAARLRPEYETMLVSGLKDESEESSEFIVKQLGLDPIYIPEMSREINLVKDYKAYLNILRIIRTFKPDIVHTHAAKAGIVGRLAAWRAGTPVIIHTYHGHVFHSYFNKLKTQFIITIERFLASISDAIIAISPEQKLELSSTFKIADPDKFHVVELGYDLQSFSEDVATKRHLFRKKYQLVDDEIAIGMIGRMVPIKNISFFIEAFEQLLLLHPEKKIKAMLIGDGEIRQEIQELCKQKGLTISSPEDPVNQAKVVFTSWIYEPDVAMSGLDIIALTSLNEGTPASLIEAQAAGKPIVSTDVGGIRHIVIPEKTAFLVKNGQLSDFIACLSKLIMDTSLREKMGVAGPEFVNNRFHYNRLTSDIRELYAKLLISKNRSFKSH